jgi:hypothetical protein
MSPVQLKQLGIAASAAIKHQRFIGALSAATLPPDLHGESVSAQNEFWRHQQTGIATGRVCSFKELRNKNPDEFSLVMQHFEALAGPAYKARAVKRTVRVIEQRPGHTPEGAGMIRAVWAVAREQGLNATYVQNVCFGKFGGVTDLSLLNMGQLKQLIATLRRRGKPDGQTGRQGDAEKPKPQTAAAAPQATAKPKTREYILKPHVKPSDVDPDSIPF